MPVNYHRHNISDVVPGSNPISAREDSDARCCPENNTRCRGRRAGEEEKLWISWSLEWIAYAERPLKPSELLCALAVASESVPPSIRHEESSQAQCPFLLRLHRILNQNRIIDSSTNETMERKHAMSALQSSSRELDGDRVHESIAYTCLTYMKWYPQVMLEQPYTKSEAEDNLFFSPTALLPYVIEYWPVHFRFGERATVRLADLFHVTIGLALDAFFQTSKPVAEHCHEIGLMICACHDLIVLGQTYLEMGVEFDKLNYDETTPLHKAVLYGSRNILRVALARGLDLSTTDYEGMTALHLAVGCERLDVVDMLVGGGADVNQSNCYTGETALHMAARTGHNGILALLLSHGADDKRTTYLGETALSIARRGRNHKGEKILAGFKLWTGGTCNGKPEPNGVPNGLQPVKVEEQSCSNQRCPPSYFPR